MSASSQTTVALSENNDPAKAAPGLVLLVEDNDAHAELIARAFARHAAWRRPLLCHSVAEARRLLASEAVDLVVADFLLPDGRGVELLGEAGGEPGMPVVILTSHGDEQLAVDAMKAGAMDYVVKTERIFRALPQICDRVLREWRNIQQRRRAERALRLNEYMVSATSDLIVYLDTDHVIRAANRSYLEALGLDAAQVLDQPSAAVLGTELSAVSRPNVERALAGDGHSVQSWREFPGLGLRFFDLEYSPFIDLDGRVKGVVIRGRDITRMHRATDALRLSESHLRTIVDSEPECVKTVAGDGTVLEMNPAGLRLIGLASESMVRGRSVFSLVAPRFRDAYRELHEAVMRGESRLLEYAIKTADGDERWVETHAAPLRDGNGAVIAQLGVTRDFTHRHRIEGELRKSEARFRGLFENVPTGVFRTTRNGVVEMANPSLLRMLGASDIARFQVGDSISERFVDARSWATIVARLADSRQVDALECRLHRLDGTHLDALVSVRAVHSSDGDSLQFEGTVTDITELREAQRAVERSERLLRTVIDLVPHMIFARSRSGQYILANQATAAALKTDVDSLISQGPQITLPDTASTREFGERILALTDTDDPGRSQEYRIDLPDGTARTLIVDAIPFLPPGADESAVVGVAVDVTAERRARDLLTAQRHAMEAIASSAPVGQTLTTLCRELEQNEAGALYCVLEQAADGARVLAAPNLPADLRVFVQTAMVGNPPATTADGTIAVVDITAHPAWGDLRHRDAGAAETWACCWRSPLRGISNEALGELIMFWPTACHPRPEQAEAVAAAGNVCRIAIEQDRIRRRQASLMAMLEATPDIVTMLDAGGRVLYMNPTGMAQLGLTPQQVTLLGLEDLCTAATAARIRQTGFASAQQIGVWRDQTEFERADGTRLVTSQVLMAHRAADGSLAYYSSVARDISDRIAAERALRISEARNRTLVETAPEAILVYDADERHFVDMNDNACSMFGLTRQALSTVGPADISSPEQPGGFVAAEIIPGQIDQAIAGESLVFEWLFNGANGGTVPAEVRLVRLPSADRRLIRVSMNDISSRKRAERALRESELRFQGIFNQTFGWIGVMTPEGVLVDINDTGLRATGMRRDEVLGAPFWDAPWWAGGRETRDRLKSACRQAMAGEVVRTGLAFHSADAGLRRMDGVISPIHDHEGNISMLLAEAHDVTDRLAADQKIKEYADRLQALSQQLLETQESERRHIARELHDEIGQALTALKINLHAASSRVPDNGGELARDLFQDSLEITENLLSQVRDLSLDLRPSMLDDLGLEAALRWYTGRQAQRTGLEIVLTSPKGGIPRLTMAVETACFRLVQEALTNVVRHAEASVVKVRLAISDDTLRVSVADNGSGFDVSAVSRSAQLGGSFGLVGMRERVQLAGGSIRLGSSAGAGTVIDATFPIRSADGVAETAGGPA